LSEADPLYASSFKLQVRSGFSLLYLDGVLVLDIIPLKIQGQVPLLNLTFQSSVKFCHNVPLGIAYLEQRSSVDLSF
jgi:hypothetical protein